MAWMRGVEIIVTPKNDPKSARIFKDFRIDVEIRSTVGWPADTANISIYNLSVEETKFLQNKKFGEMFIEIRLGYLDSLPGLVNNYDYDKDKSGTRIQLTGTGLPTVFNGSITNAIGFKSPPEHITQLFCISKASGVATKFTQMRPIPRGATLEQAVRSMCSDYGFNTISTYGLQPGTLSSILVRGRNFQDTLLVELRQLLGEYNLLFTMTTSEIQIFPDTYGDKDAVTRMSKNREPIKLDANQVIGNPIAGICSMRLNTIMNTSIQPGMILDVSPLLGTEILVNGVTSVQNEKMLLNFDDAVFQYAMEDKYFIMEVVHQASTHQTEFMTSIGAITGGNSAIGKNELAWQEMYKNSVMGMG